MGSEGESTQRSITPRTATAADLPYLVDLTTVFNEEDGFPTVEGALSGRFTTFLGQSEANVTVAVASVPVGFALTTMRLILESGWVAELQDLYMRPEHRSTGIGSALIADAVRWARPSLLWCWKL